MAEHLLKQLQYDGKDIVAEVAIRDDEGNIISDTYTTNTNLVTYVASRGENLLTNGTALMGNNYNFSAFTYDGSDTYYAGGCFKKDNWGSYATFTNDELLPVDVNKKYTFHFYAKTNLTGAQCNGYMKAYDIDGNEISPYMTVGKKNTLTTLARNLHVGDTTVYFTDLTNFTGGTSQNDKGLLFWDYTNSKGYTYEAETYTRYRYTNLWTDASAVDKTNNCITLRQPWSGPEFTTGWPVSQGQDGSGAIYMRVDGTSGITFTFGSVDTWEHHYTTAEGLPSKNSFPDGKFAYGTAFIKVGLMNRPTGNQQNFKISSMTFSMTAAASDIPTVPITSISRNNINVPPVNKNVNITVPTKTSDVTNDSGFITLNDVPQELFVCTYGSTTYIEITNAIAANKIPILFMNRKLYQFFHGTGNSYYFASNFSNHSYYAICFSTNAWSQAYEALQTTANITQNITTDKASTTKYPSAKTVYDAVQEVREVAEGKANTYVVSKTTNPVLNSQANSISIEGNLVDVSGNTIIMKDTKLGDNFLVSETDVPDRWVSNFRNAGVVQLLSDGNFSAGINTWSGLTGATYSITNGVMAVENATATSIAFYKQQCGTFTTGHKYMVVYNLKASRNGVQVGYGHAGNYRTRQWTLTTDWASYYYIDQPSNISDRIMRIYAGCQTGDSFWIKNCMVLDLTAIYGEGEEPTTYAQFKDSFPNDYYVYNMDPGAKVVELSKLETSKIDIGTLNTNNAGPLVVSDGESFSSNINLAKIAKTAQYSDLSGTPVLATVATTGDYDDLLNQPHIPSSEDYVDLTTNQNIGGVKAFTQRPTLKGIQHIPLEYNELDSVISYSSGIIDTGINVKSNYRYTLVFEQNNTTNYRIWGAFGQASYIGKNISLTYGSNNWMVRYNCSTTGDGNVILNQIDTSRHTLQLEPNGDIYLDGVNKGKSTGYIANTDIGYPAYLFTINPGGTAPTAIMNGKIIYYSVEDEEGTLLQELYPAQRKSDHVIGFYDTVANNFLTALSGELIGGTIISDTQFCVDGDFATVATTGNYMDLNNRPIIPIVNSGVLTIQKNGTALNTFSANESGNKTVNIEVPTTTNSITNNGEDGTHPFIDTEDIKYTNAQGCTVAVGGIAKGTTFDHQSVLTILENMLYPYVAFDFKSISTSSAAGTYEYGTSVTVNSVTPTFTLGSKAINSVKIGTTSGASDLYNGVSATTATAITLTTSCVFNGQTGGKIYCTLGDGTNSITKDASIGYSYYPYYMMSDSTSLTTIAKNAATKSTSGACTSSGVSVTASDNTYIWFILPSSYTQSKIQYEALGQWYDWTAGTSSAQTVSITLNSGITINNYKAYRINTKMAAGTTKFRIVA